MRETKSDSADSSDSPSNSNKSDKWLTHDADLETPGLQDSDLETSEKADSSAEKESSNISSDDSLPSSEASDDADDPNKSKARGGDDVEMLSLKKVAILAALIVPLYFAANFLDVWLASRSNFDGEVPAAVVLGAAQYNGEPSQVLRGRLDRSAELFNNGQVELIVVTGGGQEADITTEAKAGYNYLRNSAGLDDEDLLLEVDGASTYESMAASQRFLSADGIDKVVVVTDPYHAKRAQLIAREVGLDAEVAVTNGDRSMSRIFRESLAVSAGRLVSFRRLDAWLQP